MNYSLAKASAFAAVAVATTLVVTCMNGTAVRANDDSGNSKSEIGLKIAPVPLNLKGRDPEMVGYGSYLVNATADCNGCHTKGPDVEYLPTGNPYFGAQAKIDPATYLGGGQNFGALLPGSAEIVSRNLTPDKTGRPAGGLTYQEFLSVIRHGTDFDHLHPTCSGAPNANCVPPPFDGSLLQVMPWPTFRQMTDSDIYAIYQYLSTVPCIAGPPAPSNLHNECH